MKIIFEGLDNTGKGTQIYALKKHYKHPFQVLHFGSNPYKDKQEAKKYSCKLFISTISCSCSSICFNIFPKWESIILFLWYLMKKEYLIGISMFINFEITILFLKCLALSLNKWIFLSNWYLLNSSVILAIVYLWLCFLYTLIIS